MDAKQGFRPANDLAMNEHAAPQPPIAMQLPQEFTIHGHTFADPYAWLKEKQNPEVAAYLEAENAYTDAVMKPTEALQETLYRGTAGHIKQTDVAVPYRLRRVLRITREPRKGNNIRSSAASEDR